MRKLIAQTFFQKYSFTLEYFLLLLIIVFGSILRLEGVITNSFAFTYDVGRDMINLAAIIQIHKLPLIGPTTGIQGIFYGPWWYLILAIPFFLFNGDPQFVALFISAIGIIVIILGYIVGKKIRGAFLGIIFAMFLSVSPVMVGTSSQIWSPNLAPFFVLLILFVLYHMYKNLQQQKTGIIYFLLLGILLGLTIDMEIVFGTLLAAGISIALLIFYKKQIFKNIPLFLLGLFVIFSPRILFDIRHQLLMGKAFLAFFHGNSSSLTALPLVLFQRVLFLKNLWDDTLGYHNSVIDFVILICVFIMIGIFYKKATNMEKMFLQTIGVVLGVFLVGLSFFIHDIWPHYFVGIPVFYILLISIGITMAKDFLSISVAFVMIIVLLLINIPQIKMILDIRKPVWEGNAAVYRNQLAVIDYIYHEARGRQFKYIVYTPPVNDYSYRYLFPWYGKKTYGYVPEVNKASLFFVILEPDYEQPSRLQQWLQQRSNDGKIIKQQKLKGGIIVQTRID